MKSFSSFGYNGVLVLIKRKKYRGIMNVFYAMSLAPFISNPLANNPVFVLIRRRGGGILKKKARKKKENAWN